MCVCVCLCEKFPHEDLNTGLYLHTPNFTNTYTITIALKVHNDNKVKHLY